MKQEQLIIWLNRDLVEGESVDEFTVDKECPFIKIYCQENSFEVGLSSKWLILPLIVMLIQVYGNWCVGAAIHMPLL